MTTTESTPLGRRERNKRDKLDRITLAAGELFAEYGVDAVTTQQVADRADIGTGTLFLYARNKAELLLLVQNSHYAEALDTGRVDAMTAIDPLGAVMAIVRPVVECNRRHVGNGRAYLREVVFGDATEPHHHTALALMNETEVAIAEALSRAGMGDAADRARIVAAIMLLGLSAAASAEVSVDELMEGIRNQVRLVLQ